MTTPLAKLTAEVKLLNLPGSLRFLNRLLAASRSEVTDPAFVRMLTLRKGGTPTFFVRFLAKQLLLHSSEYSVNPLREKKYFELYDLFFQHDDPIADDPTWAKADPSGLFERMFAQQIPAQHQDLMQLYGLSLALYRDIGLSGPAHDYCLRSNVEDTIGMSVTDFMRMGFLCQGFTFPHSDGVSCRGAFSSEIVRDVAQQGFPTHDLTLWTRFLSLVACSRKEFSGLSQKEIFTAKSPAYTPFEFNPLLRFPVSRIDNRDYLSVDPQLLLERTTLGLFYDCWERDGKSFTEKFGHSFDILVGNLLRSVQHECPPWWEGESTRPKLKTEGKVADWVITGKTATTLFECKSMRPNLKLTTYGDETALEEVRKRIADAVIQLTTHARGIEAGRWVERGLLARPCVGVVVTYGPIYTANLPFMRCRVQEKVRAAIGDPIPYVVLSIRDVDHLVRLCELGVSVGDAVTTMSGGEGSADPLRVYSSVFDGHTPTSTFSQQKYEAFSEELYTPDRFALQYIV